MNTLTPLAQLAPPRLAAPVRLTRKQKAAIIVRLMMNEGADVPLADLPDDLQMALTQQMGAMRLVDRATLASVVEEFADQLEAVGLSFPNGLAGALSALDGKLSPHTAARLRREAGVRQTGDPWVRIRAMEVERLVPVLESESTEVAAVLLSKLDVNKAAEALSRLPGEKARRITYAVSLTGQVTPDAVDRIGLSLASQLDSVPERAFADGPEARVGAILNYSRANTREDVLTGLDEADRDFAEKVRRAIFTFPNIATRLEPRDVPKLTRAVDQDVLVTAMAAATEGEAADSVAFILENMSTRMADALKEQIAEAGKIKPKVGEEAMTAVIGAIRELEASGEIVLITGEEEEDEEG